MKESLLQSLTRMAACCPSSALSCIGAGLGSAWYFIDKRHRVEIEKRIQFAFPTKDARHICRKFYSHLGKTVFEIPLLHKMGSPGTDLFFDNRDAAKIRAQLDKGKGAIVATGHIGNWEIAGASAAVSGIEINAVAKPQKPRFLDAVLTRLREETGQRIIPQKGAFRKMVRALRSNKPVALLMDHDVRKEGVFVPFFNRPASTLPTAAYLALMTDAPLLAGCAVRVSHSRHKLIISDPIQWDKGLKKNRGVAIYEILTKINHRLEEFIRQAPEQWLWIQNRWRTSPGDKR